MENLKQLSNKNKIDLLINEIETVIIGKRDTIKLTVAAFLAEGHILFEDIPGVGKTMLVKTFAKAVQAAYTRIQFTPDLLPSDILGVSIFNDQQQQFDFHPGPIFTDILIADEINRTTPRSQAALLEAMSEKQLTIDGKTYPLSPNFFVLATQNPFDYEGTYPLPEAQLDRFLLNLKIGYPTFEEEKELLTKENRQARLAKVQPLLEKTEIRALKRAVTEVYVSPVLIDYALTLVHKTRTHPKIKLGISPRGSMAFLQVAKALAVTEGRDYCLPDDFVKLILPVFGHRLILANNYKQQPDAIEKILADVQASVPIPVRD